MESAVGRLTLICDDSNLKAIEFGGNMDIENYTENQFHPVLLETEQQLNDYFSGTLKSFSISLSPAGTIFQRAVWNSLTTIPYGETVSYGDVAVSIGNPKSVRAVGQANNKNPIPIIIPCHRVVGKNGSLVGYAGGLEIKKHLLTLEDSTEKGIAL